MRTAVVGVSASIQTIQSRSLRHSHAHRLRLGASYDRTRVSRRVSFPAANAAATSSEPVVVAEPGEESSVAIRKYLTSIGWDRAWVDVVTDRVVRSPDTSATTSLIKAVVEYLTGLGVPSQSVCNMAALNHEIMAVPAQQLQEVVQFIRQKGVDGESLVTLLEAYPKLLTFRPGPSGALEKGKTRASVDVLEQAGPKKALVSYWREGAAFTAPVAPVKPSAAA